MALPTYLDLVNDVLVRMREPQVSTVSENTVSTLVGKYVNDAKRQVSDAYDWDAFNTPITVNTIANTTGPYSITGAGVRYKTMDVINTTSFYELSPLSHANYDSFYYTTPTPTKGLPMYYSIKGVDTSGDIKVNFWPVPDAVYAIRFSLIVPEADFTTDTSTTLLAKEPIVLGAFARALIERGEDGGLNSSEAFAMYKSCMSDLIALELARSPENDTFEAV
jgi:hypothetical protein